MAAYALRFIAGRYKGGEFPLRPNREIVVGRGSEFDMVLDEDMVSRRHAKILTLHGQIVLQDLKSTNGTFVNGERINVARLAAGDKVLIGTSIMELIEVSQEHGMVTGATLKGGATPAAGASVEIPAAGPTAPPVEADTERAAPPPEAARATFAPGDAMTGRFPDDEVSLPDLVELFAANRRTGILYVSADNGATGEIHLREGQLVYAGVGEPDGDGRSPVAPIKAFNRMLTWQEGSFRLDTTAELPEPEVTLEDSTQHLLVDGLRQWDELRKYEAHLPTRWQSLALNSPILPRLSALSAETLDTLQIAHNFGNVGEVLDHSEASDLETWQDLLYLLQNGYIALV